MLFSIWKDPSIIEAASWRLASELVRRHPKTLRLVRTHPGDGQYDCLWLFELDGSPVRIVLNRAGTIQVHGRLDGRRPDWPPTDWSEYLSADPSEFLKHLEEAAGLPSPVSVPPSTPRTLTYRVLASIAATAIKTVHPISIASGFIDTSGYGGGQNNEGFASFPKIPRELRVAQAADLLGEPGYRFWFVDRDRTPLLAFEQDRGLVWTADGDEAVDLMALYRKSGRNVLVTTLRILERADRP